MIYYDLYSFSEVPEINEIIKKIDNEVIDINDEKILKINYPVAFAFSLLEKYENKR
jgi:hypothetical protein